MSRDTRVQTAAVAAEAPSPAEIRDELRRYLVEVSDGALSHDAIDPSAPLVDHGYVDSLSAVMFLAHVEERYGVRIEDVELVERITSLEAIAAHVHARL
jgi:acyl carrier protein